MTRIEALRDIVKDGVIFLETEKKGIMDRTLSDTLLERSKYDIIEVAMGVRRSGKSTLLHIVGRALKEKRRVYYINFEDERFSPQEGDLADLSTLLELNDSVLLIDEPQNMPGWEKWVRRMHDRGMKVYITGSNSHLLSSEIATSLAGRKKQHEVFPFSFQKYLQAKNSENVPGDQRVRLLEEYMQNGGFPYPTTSGDTSILKEYREDIVEKDILLRHGIKEPFKFKNLVRFIMSNPGVYLSHRAIKGFLDISHPTLKNYLGYLEEAYAVISLEKFSFSEKVRIQNPKKVYPIDNGLLLKKDLKGRLLESCIVQQMRRYTTDFFYWKDERGREVDIYLPEESIAIQIVYDLNEDNISREETPLGSAAREFSSKGIIVYMYATVETQYPSIRASDLLIGDPVEALRKAISQHGG